MKKSRRPSVVPASLPSSTRHGGFTLIEVMVALVVLVLGVLGAAAMTLTALRDGKQSGLRSQASAFAYEIADLMRANPGQETLFTGTSTPTSVTTCYSSGCVPADMAKNDYYEWRTKLLDATTGLPNAAYVICRDSTLLASSNYPSCDNAATSPLVVKLRWDEKKNNARDAAATTTGVTQQYLTVPVQPY